MHNSEQDHCCRKDVDLLAIIRLALLEFWGHVGHGASEGLQSVSDKAKLIDLQVHVLIYEDVLELEVSMGDSLALDVLEDVKHLTKKEPSAIFAHSSHGLADVEQMASGHVLQLEIDNFLNLFS